MNKEIKVYPSVLSADLSNLQNEINRAENFVDGFHFDIMDNHFVDNLTFGYPVVKNIKSRKPINVHLMVSNPSSLINDFAKINPEVIYVHFESSPHIFKTLQDIKNKGIHAGIAINPSTSVETAYEAFNFVNHILIMGVNPGFSGQQFITNTLEKIIKIRKNFVNKNICVDGGVNQKTVSDILNAGANELVSGSYFWDNDFATAVSSLKNG